MAGVAAIALIAIGWILYIAKITEAASEETLDAILRISLVAALGLAVLPLLPRAGLVWNLALAGFVAAPAVAYALDGPALVAAFAYAVLIVVGTWLVGRRRPVRAARAADAELADVLRGRGGLVLVVGVCTLSGFMLFAPLSGLDRVFIALGVLLASLAIVRAGDAPWRAIAAVFVALSFTMLVFVFLLIYDIYPLAPVALVAAGAALAAVPAFFALLQGRGRQRVET